MAWGRAIRWCHGRGAGSVFRPRKWDVWGMACWAALWAYRVSSFCITGVRSRHPESAHCDRWPGCHSAGQIALASRLLGGTGISCQCGVAQVPSKTVKFESKHALGRGRGDVNGQHGCDGDTNAGGWCGGLECPGKTGRLPRRARYWCNCFGWYNGWIGNPWTRWTRRGDSSDCCGSARSCSGDRGNRGQFHCRGDSFDTRRSWRWRQCLPVGGSVLQQTHSRRIISTFQCHCRGSWYSTNSLQCPRPHGARYAQRHNGTTICGIQHYRDQGCNQWLGSRSWLDSSLSERFRDLFRWGWQCLSADARWWQGHHLSHGQCGT